MGGGGSFINSGLCDKSLKKKKSGRDERGCYIIWGGKGTSELRPEGNKANHAKPKSAATMEPHHHPPKQKLKRLWQHFCLFACLQAALALS